MYQIGGTRAISTTPQKPLSATSLSSEYTFPPTSLSARDSPRFCCPLIGAARPGARACTPAMNVWPICVVICSTNCKQSCPMFPPGCSRVCVTIAGLSIAVRHCFAHSANSGSWLITGSMIESCRRLFPFASACDATKHQSRTNCHCIDVFHHRFPYMAWQAVSL